VKLHNSPRRDTRLTNRPKNNKTLQIKNTMSEDCRNACDVTTLLF